LKGGEERRKEGREKKGGEGKEGKGGKGRNPKTKSMATTFVLTETAHSKLRLCISNKSLDDFLLSPTLA